ncbi:MAG: hypothetical protein ACJ8HJ_13215 [Massilia sp.]
MDKNEFIYNVNGLRDNEAAGQALYRCRTDVGQKPGEQKKRLFCTSGAVDIQHLVHSRAGFACLQGACRMRTLVWMRRRHHVLSVDKTKVEQRLRRVWLRQCPASFFLQTKRRSRRTGFAARRSFGTFPSLVNLDRK